MARKSRQSFRDCGAVTVLVGKVTQLHPKTPEIPNFARSCDRNRPKTVTALLSHPPLPSSSPVVFLVGFASFLPLRLVPDKSGLSSSYGCRGSIRHLRIFASSIWRIRYKYSAISCFSFMESWYTECLPYRSRASLSSSVQSSMSEIFL